MERSMGLSAETLRMRARPGRFMDASRALTVVGALGTVVIGGRTRGGAALAGAALVPDPCARASPSSKLGRRQRATLDTR